MKFALALIAGLLGGLMGGPMAAFIGMAVGFACGAIIQGQSAPKKSDTAAKQEPPAQAQTTRLEERVKALEKEVGLLHAQVHRLIEAAKSGPAVAAPTAAPVPAPATPPTEAMVFNLPARKPAAPATTVPVAAPPPAVDLLPEVISLVPEETSAVSPPAATEAPAPAAAGPRRLDATPLAFPREATEPPPVPVPPPSALAPAPARWRPPPPPPVPTLREQMPDWLSRWIFGGNTIVKVGVLILFLGLAFLLRYAAERVTVPIELRYAGVALMGAVLLGLGWRLRNRLDASGGKGYGLILQGAGIGVFYLTTLAAIKLNPLLSPGVGFAFMALVALLGAVLAVAQNAPWLALVSVLEGFAAPVLVSTGGGNHVALFTYLAILDLGIFVMAWSRAWRPLNLVGAVGTFTLAGGWAQAHYTDAVYPSTQAFLLLFFLLFTGIGVLFARRALALGDAPDPRRPLSARAAEALAQVGRVDSTLTFGVPLAAFGLQYLMVRDDPWGPAWAAFGFALFYLVLGGALLRGRNIRYSLLGEAHVIVSVIFGTLTIPLALEGAWTGATWAVEAAGMYWLGMRQQRAYARAFAFAVMGGAALRLATSLGLDLHRPDTPLVTGPVLGVALLGASALAMLAAHRRAPADEHASWEPPLASALPWLATASVTCIAWMLWSPMWASVVTAWLALAWHAASMRLGGRAGPCVTAMHAVALAGLASTLHTLDGTAMLANGWRGLAAAVLIGVALLLTAGLGLRAHLRAARDSGTAPQWSMGSGIGLLAGLALLNLSLLFVMPAEHAAWVWPVTGLLSLWLGLRIGHPALPLAWLALQAGAAAATLVFGPPLWPLDTALPWLPALWGPLVLTLTGFLAGHLLRHPRGPDAEPPPMWASEPAVQWGIVLWGLAWWSQVLPPGLHRHLAASASLAQWPAWLALWVTGTSALMAAAARWRHWPVLGQATWATVPAWVLIAFIGPATSGLAPLAELGWLAWPLALAWHLLLLRRQESWWPAQRLQVLHAVGAWLFILLAARECQWLTASMGEPGSAWPALGWMAVPALALLLLSRPGLLRRWPLAAYPSTYLGAVCAPLAGYLLLWLWVGNTGSGDASPLPYLPLLNPLEIGQGLVLLSLALWVRALPEDLRARLPRTGLLGGLGLTAFALLTGLVLRACHHWAGVPWQGDALFGSTLTQAALSVTWSLVGVGLMLLGHRRLERLVWSAGAGLLGIVVVKLFLVELADRGGLYRIVSFIVVGLLLLAVGYFAPVPPKQKDAADTEPA